jgi:hypothetical protein
MLASPLAAGLERKLENARKCAKRAAIKKTGPAQFKGEADRWKHFVEWMRHSILYYRPRRQTNKNHTRFYKEQRETVRELAMQVVVETADRQQIYKMADDARRAVRRKRHVNVSPTLRALLEDHAKTRQFLATFISDRLGSEILLPEFQPICIRQSENHEKMKRALVP